jgi:hypothetical protein
MVRHAFLGCATVIALLCACGRSIAEEPAPPAFVPLFANDSFDGWHGATENYQLQDGVLACRPKKGGNIYTDADYADSVLQFEFRLTPAGNNGIGLRVPDGGHASYEGMEIQILDDGHAKYDKLKPYQAHGSVYGLIPAEKGHLKPTGEWNTQEIRCVGRKVKITLNGVTIVDGDLDEATKDGPLDETEHPGAARTSGKLCFCTHGSEVDFRNLRIQRLDTAP